MLYFSCFDGISAPRSCAGVALFCCVAFAGCSHLHRKPADNYVYVTARHTYLRDRVAAVSNRTGEVTNGERLVVLDRARRWVKVRTPQNQVGWIEEKLTADQTLADKFAELEKQNVHDPVVAMASTRDEVYMHIAPGRETEHFYLLAEGESLSLLHRATVPKHVAPEAEAVRKPVPLPLPSRRGRNGAVAAEKAFLPEGPPPVVMEDWWLARDSKGDIGWVYSRMIDVNEPDTLARYSEGQRIVGAYLLTTVDDPDSGVINNGQTVTKIPEYVTVLSPYKAGLPYDFDQVRVFTWNVKKHRYETAYRERNIAGYLPLQVGPKPDPYAKTPAAAAPLPGFTYHVLAADAPLPTPDPVSGEVHPLHTIAKTYRLEGNVCRRVLAPDAAAPEEAHLVPESAKRARAHGRHR